jgi:ABC-2 type transport system ATP-binding protein
MDEAARCHRIGFLRRGKMISEGTPGQLRQSLDRKIIELRGEPLALLKRIAIGDPDVADVHSFGDRLHLRMKESATPAIIDRLREAVNQNAGVFVDARPVSPTLEDVFIALANQEN